MPTMETVKSFKTAMASEQGAFGPFMITTVSCACVKYSAPGTAP